MALSDVPRGTANRPVGDGHVGVGGSVLLIAACRARNGKSAESVQSFMLFVPVRSRRWLLTALLALIPFPTLNASLCSYHTWTLGEIAGAPVVVIGRVVSLEMENGPRLAGDPKQSALPQMMTAEVEVLRFTQQSKTAGARPTGRLKIRFLGRDGPDFSFCAREFPDLRPGRVLLLPLRANLEGASAPWQLIGADGPGLTTQISAEMEEMGLVAHDGRSFIVREIANSFRHGAPLAVFVAASLEATQADYLEPDLTAQLRRSIGGNAVRWAQVLSGMILSYPGRSLTLGDIRAGNVDRHRFNGFPLAQLALSQLPAATAETLVWQSLVADLSGFTDEPYHPVFAYSPSLALHPAVAYLSRYRSDAMFLEAMKTALRDDRPGSSFLAARLIDEGQRGCLSEALDRALKVIRRSHADGDDLFASVRLVLSYGTEEQRRQLESLAVGFKSTNPDYAAFLQLKLAQSRSGRH